MKKKVFVIHGHDKRAHGELVKLLDALGLEELSFESVANEMGPSPFVRDIVIEGIKRADAVVALFTPDEQAALYDPETGDSRAAREGGSRWQARPNVIFEAGIAFGGLADREPIVAVLGDDVRLFSDLGGVHFVQLSGPRGKANLKARLESLLGPLTPTLTDWDSSPQAGDFAAVARRRWDYFDEIQDLARNLKNKRLTEKGLSRSLLDLVKGVLESDPEREWAEVDAKSFMEAMASIADPDMADDAYWWLAVYGFFRFDNIDNWGAHKNADWTDSVRYADVPKRAIALIERLIAQRKR
jgi:hypothetical protein